MAAVGFFAYLSFAQHTEMILAALQGELGATVRNGAPLLEAADAVGADAPSRARAKIVLDELAGRNPNNREFRLLTVAADGSARIAASSALPTLDHEGPLYDADAAILDTLKTCVSGETSCVTPLYTDEEGRWITGLAPVRDAEGRMVAILSADRAATEYTREVAATIRQMAQYSAAALFVGAVLGVFVSFRITRPLEKLYNASADARAGRFTPVEVTGTDEVSILTRDFNETQEILGAQMEELASLNRELEQRVETRTAQLSESYNDLRDRQQVIQREMAVARRVQETIVPKSLHREKITIDVAYVPIMAIGGDLGLVIEQSSTRFDVAIGDVTGHGIGAALVVNRAHMLLSQLYLANAPLDSLFHRLDYFLSQEIADIGIFMTLLACRFDLEAMKMECGGGGHPPGLLYRLAERKIFPLESRCGMLGVGDIFCDDPPVVAMDIAVGDFVVLYTDGLIEAANPDEEQFGAERLEETIISEGQKGADGKKLAESITAAAKDFTGGYFQDDVLVLVIQVR